MGYDYIPLIDNIAYNIRQPFIDTALIHTTSSSEEMRNWIENHFKFMKDPTASLAQDGSYETLANNDLYWTSQPNLQFLPGSPGYTEPYPYGVYIHIIPG